jgi:hypothetical protein
MGGSGSDRSRDPPDYDIKPCFSNGRVNRIHDEIPSFAVRNAPARVFHNADKLRSFTVPV